MYPAKATTTTVGQSTSRLKKHDAKQVKKKPAEQQRPVAAFRDAVRASVRITIRGQGLRITS